MSLLDAPYEDRWGPRRGRIIAAALALVFTVIVGRAAWVVFNGPDRAATAAVTRVEAARRADIVDRDGELLATTLQGWSLAADPSAIWDPGEIVAGLHTVFPDMDVIGMTNVLSDRKRRFAWIKRGLSERERKAVRDLGLEGVRFVEEPQRVYPNGALAGHLLGYTNVDGDGLEGIERIFDKQLKSGDGPLQLTIDASVQFVMEEEIQGALEHFDMKGAVGIVMDGRTGAVRAIASWPFSDPRKRGVEPADAKTNRAINSRMELGSIYKPLTVAAALEAGVLSLKDRFDVSAPIRIGAAQVRDQHTLPHPASVTVGEIIAHSSNIGTARIAERLGPEGLRAFLDKVHLLGGGESGEGPQPASPLTPAKWDTTTMATVAYGHGISVSPLAFAMTYTPFATGGEFVPAQFVEPIDPAGPARERVMTVETARAVMETLRKTVVEGSGKLADAPGYEVAGKTGTAEKPTPDGYDANRNITSFAAVFPASRPEFVVLVVLDEAQPRTGDQRTAAVTAALIAGKVIARAAPILGVKPVLAASSVEEARLDRTGAGTP